MTDDETEITEMHQLGRYRLVESIGSGAAAVVYRGYDPEIDRTLAIKVLRQDSGQLSEEFRKRFLREAQSAGRLAHPNIVTIHDVGEWQQQPFIVMELIKGVPLDQRMLQKPALEQDQIVDIAIQLAQTLDYAHQQGIIHRDIKPSNMIWLAETQTIKLTDFGIARSLTVEDDQTKTGQVLGTPQYMSPEQILGTKIDGRADLFSLGVVLYQLLSGSKAFSGDTLGSLFLHITGEPHIPLHQNAPQVPEQLAQIVDKLLEKEPSQRFQTGSELAQALETFKSGDKPGVSPVAPATPRKRSGHIWIAAALISLLLIAYLLMDGANIDETGANLAQVQAPPPIVAETRLDPEVSAESNPVPESASTVAPAKQEQIVVAEEQETTLDDRTPLSAQQGITEDKEEQKTASKTVVASAPSVTPRQPVVAAPQRLLISFASTAGNGQWQLSSGREVAQIEKQIADSFRKRGYEIADKHALSGRLNLLDLLTTPENTALLHKAKASGILLTIFGQLSVTDAGNIMNLGMHTYNGELTLRLTDVSRGILIDSYQSHAKIADISKGSARIKLQKRLLNSELLEWLDSITLPGP